MVPPSRRRFAAIYWRASPPVRAILDRPGPLIQASARAIRRGPTRPTKHRGRDMTVPFALTIAIEQGRASPAGSRRNRLLSLDPAVRAAAHAEVAAADAEIAERALTIAQGAANALQRRTARARRQSEVARRTAAAQRRCTPSPGRKRPTRKSARKRRVTS